LVALCLTVLLLVAYLIITRRLSSAEAQAVAQAQEVLDLEQAAVLDGDGELFFASLDDSPAWRSAQLDFELLRRIREGRTVTHAERHNEILWANVAWMEDGNQLQGVQFFRTLPNRLEHIESDENYWGPLHAHPQAWGLLTLRERDEPWAQQIAAYVDAEIKRLCDVACQADLLPLEIEIRGDFRKTAEVGRIQIPSPRLAGLDELGHPSPYFWRLLQGAVADGLSPVTIRFAIPPPRTSLCCWSLDYSAAAEAFMAAHPTIRVELVELDSLPSDLAQLAREYDGAAVAPHVEAITAGLVYDLTDFATTDSSLDSGDFYERIWQGAHWQDRLWMVPYAAELRLIFYDHLAMEQARQPAPTLFWSWDDLFALGRASVAENPDHAPLQWSLLDSNGDTLFAYAYALQPACTGPEVAACPPSLQDSTVAQTLDWYKSLVKRRITADVLSSSTADRLRAQWLLQSATRRAAIWVEEPGRYEAHQLAYPVGVAPFPGLSSAEGVTPLWVEGAFISQTTQNPRAVWEWLKFLSFQAPVARYRLVPARPSVAVQAEYWTSLPRPLVNPMRTAFNLGRPVRLDERQLFTAEQIAAVLSGELAPEDATQLAETRWFADAE
jgi:ABC-type glycerol-3-phosphate transport system substrate-binding protein